MRAPDRDPREKPLARIEFAQRLRELRVLRGFRTARSLANALGIDENRYTRYERAEVEPDLSLIRLMGAVLKTTPNELLGLDTGLMPGFSDEAAAMGGLDTSAGTVPTATAVASRAPALMWALAREIAELRAERDQRAAPSAKAASPMVGHQATSALYQAISRDPFGAIARVVADPVFAAAPADVTQRLRSLIDELTMALSMGRGRKARE